MNSIMIVEDDGLIALDLKKKLEHAGYTVPAVADNSAEALKKVESLRPALVLMDIRLRGPRDGIETADQIRRRFQVPVRFSVDAIAAALLTVVTSVCVTAWFGAITAATAWPTFATPGVAWTTVAGMLAPT